MHRSYVVRVWIRALCGNVKAHHAASLGFSASPAGKGKTSLRPYSWISRKVWALLAAAPTLICGHKQVVAISIPSWGGDVSKTSEANQGGLALTCVLSSAAVTARSSTTAERLSLASSTRSLMASLFIFPVGVRLGAHAHAHACVMHRLRSSSWQRDSAY